MKEHVFPTAVPDRFPALPVGFTPLNTVPVRVVHWRKKSAIQPPEGEPFTIVAPDHLPQTSAFAPLENSGPVMTTVTAKMRIRRLDLAGDCRWAKDRSMAPKCAMSVPGAGSGKVTKINELGFPLALKLSAFQSMATGFRSPETAVAGHSDWRSRNAQSVAVKTG